jgi:hypothetical protein
MQAQSGALFASAGHFYAVSVSSLLSQLDLLRSAVLLRLMEKLTLSLRDCAQYA